MELLVKDGIIHVLILFLAFIAYAFFKAEGDKMLFYPDKFKNNKWWKKLSPADQYFKPISYYLSFLKDGWHCLEFLKILMIPVAAGVFDLGVGIALGFFAFVIQGIWMK